MSMSVEALEAELLRLPNADRARLLDRVVASLDADADRERAWSALAARRDAEIDSGSVVPIPVAQAIASLRSELA